MQAIPKSLLSSNNSTGSELLDHDRMKPVSSYVYLANHNNPIGLLGITGLGIIFGAFFNCKVLKSGNVDGTFTHPHTILNSEHSLATDMLK